MRLKSQVNCVQIDLPVAHRLLDSAVKGSRDIKMSELINHPTVSDPEIMRVFSNARVNERDALIDYVNLRPGLTVMDIQAAGGFLSDEIYKRLVGNVVNVCIEPNSELRSRLNPAFQAINNPVENFFSVGDGSIDIAMGLIGLHHSSSHESTIKEIFRTLKPGGELAVCDVYEGSRLAAWLNEFVHENSRAGHSGNFPAPGEVSQLCEKTGFVEVREELRNVPWNFSTRSQIPVFFQGLFGLLASVEEIDQVLDKFFDIHNQDGCVSIKWPLMYCRAVKPR